MSNAEGHRARRASPREGLCRAAGTALSALVLAPAALAEPPVELTRMVFVSTRGAPGADAAPDASGVLLESARAELDAAGVTAFLEDVHARLEDAQGETSLELTCERGEYDLESGNFLAEGDVRGVLADGRRFAGPWLRYDDALALAFTDARVRIIEAEQTLEGGGFRYHVDDGRLRLTRGASVVVQP